MPAARGEDLDHVADDRPALRAGLHTLEPGELVAGDDLGQVRQQTPPAVLVELREAIRDALGELARRLAGERQPQDLVGAHEAVRDEPQHPHRHRLGLAAAGAGHDERGLGRCLDNAASDRASAGTDRAPRAITPADRPRPSVNVMKLTAPIV